MLESVPNQPAKGNLDAPTSYTAQLRPVIEAIQKGESSLINFVTQLRPLKDLMERNIKADPEAPLFNYLVSTLSSALIEKAREHNLTMPPVYEYLERCSMMTPRELMKKPRAADHVELEPIIALGAQISQVVHTINDVTGGFRKTQEGPECLLELYCASLAVGHFIKRDYAHSWSDILPLPFSNNFLTAVDAAAVEAAENIRGIEKLDKILAAIKNEEQNPERAKKAARLLFKRAALQIDYAVQNNGEMGQQQRVVDRESIQILLKVIREARPSDLIRNQGELARPENIVEIAAYTSVSQAMIQAYKELETIDLHDENLEFENYWNKNFHRDVLNLGCRMFEEAKSISSRSDLELGVGFTRFLDFARISSTRNPSNDISKRFIERLVAELNW